MEKGRKQIQYEFFRGAKESHQEQSKRNFIDIFRISLNPEHVVLGAVFLILTVIISFSIGVEKGKTVVAKENKAVPLEQPVATPVPVTQKTGPTQEAISTPPVEEAVATIKTKEIKLGKYTVQVASFKKESFAEKEAQRLQKLGHEILVMPKGKYNIVCVGNFETKKEAERLIGTLKKQYNDCYIRRL
ncbi:SPOR domain-containing protein [Candidatus Omnitrophota bacterium]